MTKELKIVVVGAGAIGGITAAFLAESGHDVEIVAKHKNATETISNTGLTLSGITNKTVRIKAVETVSHLSGKKDIFIIATKAYDMVDVAKSLLGLAKDNSLFVGMQNGIIIDLLVEAVGKERAVGCVVGFGATLAAPANVIHTSTGDLTIGMMDGQVPSNLDTLKEVLTSVAPTHISRNIYCELYSKLLINSCITSLGAVSGLKLGKMLKHKKLRNIFIEIIREGVAVADAMKINIPLYANKVNYYTLANKKGGFASLKRHLIIRVVGIKYRNLKSSSLQSLERGQKTEIAFFNGYISKKGSEFGVPTPINDHIIKVISEIENKSRKSTFNNFCDEVFNRFN